MKEEGEEKMQKLCKKCGSKIDKGSKICKECGEKTEDIDMDSNKKQDEKQPDKDQTSPVTSSVDPNSPEKKTGKTKNKLIIGTIVIAFVFILLIISFYFTSNNVTGGYKPGDIKYFFGDEWEYKTTLYYDEGEQDKHIYSQEIKDEITLDIDDVTYNLYEMKIYGKYISSEKIFKQGNLSLKLSEGSWIKTKYFNPEYEVYKYSNINYRTFDILDDQGQPTGENYIETSNNETTLKKISGGIPDWVEVGTTWVTTYYTNWSESLISSTTTEGDTSSYPKLFNGEGTKTINSECLSKKNITTQAGTFETYEIRHDTVGKDEYEIAYFCPKIKSEVKYILYSNDGFQIYTEELVNYSIKSEQTSSNNSLIESKFYGAWDNQQEEVNITWKFYSNNTLDWTLKEYNYTYDIFDWKIQNDQLKISVGSTSVYYDFKFSDNESTLELSKEEYGIDELQTLIKQ